MSWRQVDPTEQRLAKWTRCQLSGEALAPPVAADELGHLFNKDAVVNGGPPAPSTLCALHVRHVTSTHDHAEGIYYTISHSRILLVLHSVLSMSALHGLLP